MSFSLGGKKEKSSQTQNTTQSYTPNAQYLGMVQGGLDKALGLAGNFQPLTQEAINNFANPYIGDVGNQISSQLGRSRDLASNEIRGRAAQAGAFGGSGWGLLESENQKNFADAEAQALTGLRASAYDKATQTAQSEEQRRQQAQLASIQSYLGGLGLLGNWGTTTGNMSGTSKGSQMGFNAGFTYGGS